MSEKVYVDTGSVFDKVTEKENNPTGYQSKKMQRLSEKDKEQDIDMRREYADKTYLFVCIYMCFVFFLIFLACSPSTFQMSDTVLITLLGTTTINVIGLFAIVMNYLFPKK